MVSVETPFSRDLDPYPNTNPPTLPTLSIVKSRTNLLEINGRYLSFEVSERWNGRVVGNVTVEGQVSVGGFDYKGSDD